VDFNTFLKSGIAAGKENDLAERELSGSVDFSRTSEINVNKDIYLEAEAKGMTLSELLETAEYDPSPAGSPLDAFERQLALAGIRLGGKNPTLVDQFYQTKIPPWLISFTRRRHH